MVKFRNRIRGMGFHRFDTSYTIYPTHMYLDQDMYGDRRLTAGRGDWMRHRSYSMVHALTSRLVSEVRRQVKGTHS